MGKKPTAKNSKHKRKNSKRLFNLLLLNYTNKVVDLLQVAKNPMMTSIKTNCRPMLCSFLTVVVIHVVVVRNTVVVIIVVQIVSDAISVCVATSGGLDTLHEGRQLDQAQGQ